MCILLILLFCIVPLKAQLIPIANPDSLAAYTHFLGSDAMEGRGTGSRGLHKAAGYLAQKLSSSGLQAAGQNNTFFQKVPMHGTKVMPASTLQIYFDNESLYLLYGRDFLVMKYGGEVYRPGLLPVVFAGYGIHAPEFDYNDYQGLDAGGKIVVILDGEPVSEDRQFFSGLENTIYARAESKIRTAIANGAVGSIIIHNPGLNHTSSWAKKRTEYSFEEVTLPGRVTGHTTLYLNQDKADLLFRGSGKSYTDWLNSPIKNRRGYDLHTKAAFNGVFRQREFKSDNVIAMLQGRDSVLSRQYVVIGAHYDHLGIGETVDGDSIYNGVLDNAVGCAVTIELARMFSSAAFRPRRSIAFLFFSGEEKGLLGSDFYTGHPPIDLTKTVAMINIDGLSALGPFMSLIAVGGSYSDLGRRLQTVASEYGLAVETMTGASADQPFSKSDQISFAQAGIPALQVIEGFNYAGISREDVIGRTKHWFDILYHSPFDDLKQHIDYRSVARYTDFMFAFINRLLNQQDAPDWLESSPYQRKRDIP